MSKKRVVVTGLGTINPIGFNVADYWDNLINGKSGIGPITYFDASDNPTKIAGEISGYNSKDYFSVKDARKLESFTQFAIISAREAVKDSNLDIESIDSDRAGVIVGAGLGGLYTIEEQIKVLLKKGITKISPFLIPKIIPNMAAGMIAIEFGFKGPNACATTACATGTHCAGFAFRIIQHGDADIMIAGGTESAITPLGVGGFTTMRALSRRNDEPEKASRPFDKDRDGFVMGEGAGVIVLESLEHAQKRNARIYAELVGFGETCDANHMTAPLEDGSGAAKAMKLAIDDSGMTPEEVEYINAHGTSTPLNDKGETLAIKSLFGDYAYKIPISSTKSMTGHLLGGAGGVESIAVIKTIETGLIHATINQETPDPDCDLDYVPNKTREQQVRLAISNSLGFGGHNASIAFKKFDG